MRALINTHLGVSTKNVNGRIIVESEKYNKDINYQKPIK